MTTSTAVRILLAVIVVITLWKGSEAVIEITSRHPSRPYRAYYYYAGSHIPFGHHVAGPTGAGVKASRPNSRLVRRRKQRGLEGNNTTVSLGLNLTASSPLNGQTCQAYSPFNTATGPVIDSWNAASQQLPGGGTPWNIQNSQGDYTVTLFSPTNQQGQLTRVSVHTPCDGKDGESTGSEIVIHGFKTN